MNRILTCGMFFTALVFSAGSWSDAYGQQFTILNQKTERFVNRDCEKNDSCDLLQFTVVSENYLVYTDGEPNYGTRMYAEYETDKVNNLPLYVIVQFLQGCSFTSYINEKGEVGRRMRREVTSFDEYSGYRFPQWKIDSFDKDPVYFSSFGGVGRDRIGKYLWSAPPWSWNKNQAAEVKVKRYQTSVPAIPRLFVTDRPSPAFKMDTEANNISMRFRTCIYKSKDVPGATTRDNVDFAPPISCLPWSSSFIYDFTAGKFDSPTGIDPFCLEPREVKPLE